jgi:hypothetical protein
MMARTATTTATTATTWAVARCAGRYRDITRSGSCSHAGAWRRSGDRLVPGPGPPDGSSRDVDARAWKLGFRVGMGLLLLPPRAKLGRRSAADVRCRLRRDGLGVL